MSHLLVWKIWNCALIRKLVSSYEFILEMAIQVGHLDTQMGPCPICSHPRLSTFLSMYPAFAHSYLQLIFVHITDKTIRFIVR